MLHQIIKLKDHIIFGDHGPGKLTLFNWTFSKNIILVSYNISWLRGNTFYFKDYLKTSSRIIRKEKGTFGPATLIYVSCLSFEFYKVYAVRKVLLFSFRACLVKGGSEEVRN